MSDRRLTAMLQQVLNDVRKDRSQFVLLVTNTLASASLMDTELKVLGARLEDLLQIRYAHETNLESCLRGHSFTCYYIDPTCSLPLSMLGRLATLPFSFPLPALPTGPSIWERVLEFRNDGLTSIEEPSMV